MISETDLTAQLSRARQAQARLDLSVMEYGFESRLRARLEEQQHTQMSTLTLLWRTVTGCAAAVGVLAVWFILT